MKEKLSSISNLIHESVLLLLKGRFLLTFDQLEFPVSNLPIQKRLKLLLTGINLIIRPVFTRTFPPIIQIEPVNICNLQCLTCPTGAGTLKRPEVFMTFEMYRKIIDQVHDNAYLLVFWSWGEPFLHKDACSMIKYAKDHGLFVHTSTNGHFFSKKEHARQLIESGLDSLIVAVDGLDQETYVKYRKNGDFQKVIASIKNIVAEREAAGVKHPRITFRFIVMKHNEHQIPYVRKFAENLGVDAVTFRSATVQRDGISHTSLMPDSKKFQKHSLSKTTVPEHIIKPLSKKCHRPYANLTIFSNGDLVACENDINASLPFGNVAKQSIKEILSSSESKSFLNKLIRNQAEIPFCQSCEHIKRKNHSSNVETYLLNEDLDK